MRRRRDRSWDAGTGPGAGVSPPARGGLPSGPRKRKAKPSSRSLYCRVGRLNANTGKGAMPCSVAGNGCATSGPASWGSSSGSAAPGSPSACAGNPDKSRSAPRRTSNPGTRRRAWTLPGSWHRASEAPPTDGAPPASDRRIGGSLGASSAGLGPPSGARIPGRSRGGSLGQSCVGMNTRTAPGCAGCSRSGSSGESLDGARRRRWTGRQATASDAVQGLRTNPAPRRGRLSGGRAAACWASAGRRGSSAAPLPAAVPRGPLRLRSRRRCPVAPSPAGTPWAIPPLRHRRCGSPSQRPRGSRAGRRTPATSTKPGKVPGRPDRPTNVRADPTGPRESRIRPAYSPAERNGGWGSAHRAQPSRIHLGRTPGAAQRPSRTVARTDARAASPPFQASYARAQGPQVGGPAGAVRGRPDILSPWASP